jgi:hypothetical protein
MNPNPAVAAPARATASTLPGEVVIDLDLAAPVRPPDRPRPWPRPNPRLLLALGLALTLLLSGATVPARVPLAPLFGVSTPTAAAYLLHRRVLYLGNERDVSAYAVPGGRLLWRVAKGGRILGMYFDDPSGSLVIQVNGDEVLGTVVLDAGTGATRWQRADLVTWPVPGTGLAFGQTQRLELGDISRMAVVGLADGRVRWEEPVRSELLRVGLDAEARSAAGFLLLTVDGLSVEVRDGLTGARLVAGALPDRQPELAGPLVSYQVSLVGRTIVVVGTFEATGEGADAVAYGFDATDLTPRWRTPLPGYLRIGSPCGDRLCLTGDGGIAMLDRDSGALLGSAGWRWLWPLPGGGLLAEGESGVAVVDASLTVRRPLLGWQVVTMDPVVLTGPARQWLWLLTGAGPRLLGRAPIRLLDSCQIDAGYLACWSDGHGVTVSALPPGAAAVHPA